MKMSIVCLFLAVYVSSFAVAQDQGLSASEEKLALYVARVSAHEGALKNLRDTDLVWQVVINNAKTTAGRIQFLEQHSGRALGKKPCTESNCEWSSLLDRRGTIPAAQAAGKDAGYWRTVTIPRWRAVLVRARELVRDPSDTAQLPCVGHPVTWGSLKLDGKKAAANGLHPLICENTLNTGFSY